MADKEDISCKKYQIADSEYSRLHEFLDNFPYMIMIILGLAVLFMGFETLIWKWVTSGLYLLYGIIGAFWIILFVCPYCHFFDTRLCPCGYGKISAKFRQKKDDSLFTRKFKNHIPVVIVPLWIIPTVAGVIFLITKFSLLMLVLLSFFAINSFVVLPLISKSMDAHIAPKKINVRG